MGAETVLCTDQRGNLLSNKVQVLSSIVIPPEAEMQVCCRLNSEPSGSLGLVENGFTRDTDLAVAATLCVPTTADGCWYVALMQLRNLKS